MEVTFRTKLDNQLEVFIPNIRKDPKEPPMSRKWILPMKRAAALFLWTMILASCGTPPSELPEEVGAGPARSPGILRVTRGDHDLKSPREAPPGKTLLYRLALPFQVSESQGALFANIREAQAKGTNFEAGDDIVLFDDLSRISGEEAIAVIRNHQVDGETFRVLETV